LDPTPHGSHLPSGRRLESHLEISEDVLPDNYTCSAEGVPISGKRSASLVETAPGSNYFLTKIAASY
jgi:hypothetical protein